VANQTVTTSVNYDDAAISGLLNGEDITIDGGTLTINSDVRWNQQEAVFGNITCSSTAVTGLLVDGRDVWEIPFDASTGNVPTQNALGSNGVLGGTSGATGELLRVWATGSLIHATAGGAMPASGYIKLRTKTGTFQDNEVITLPGGATVTVNSTTGGQRSWIHVVGAQTKLISAYGLSDLNFEGDWYYLQSTNGTDDQTLQYPVADFCPAIQVETAVGSNQYEWWINAATRWGTAVQQVPTDERGKFFGQVVATGVITIARRASNSCGYKPASGLKVRIPNILLSSSSSANWATNTIPATVTQRYSTANINAFFSANIKKVSGTWYWIFSGASSVVIEDSGIAARMAIANLDDSASLDSVAISGDIYSSTANLVTISSNKNVAIKNSRFNQIQNSAIFLSVTSCNNFLIENTIVDAFSGTINSIQKGTTETLGFTQCSGVKIDNCSFIGGRVLATNSQNIEINNLKYADVMFGTSPNSPRVSAISFNYVKTAKIDGFDTFAGLANVHPGTSILSLITLTENVVIRNIGTYAAPYSAGTVNPTTNIISGGSSSKIFLQRIYVSGITTTAPVATLASGAFSEVSIQNFHSEYTSSQAARIARELIAKGCKFTFDLTTYSPRAGFHWIDVFQSSTTGNIVILGNNPTSLTASQCTPSLSSLSGFNSLGSVYMPTLNDEVLWTMPYFAIGFTALSSVAFTGTNTGNFTFEFQYDLGTGWNGSWLTLNATNLAAVGSIDPQVGVKLKVKARTSVADSTNLLTFVNIEGVSNTTAQGYEYPYPDDAVGLISNLEANSRIQVYNETTTTELANLIVSGTSYSFSYLNGTTASAGDIIRIRVAKLGYLPQTLIAIATSTGFATAGNAIADQIYNANGIDGSTVTEFTADYPNIDLDITDPDGVTSVQRIYAFLRYIETTLDGIEEWYDVVNPTDEVNYEIDVTKLDLKFDNTNATPVQIIGGRVFRSDGSTIIETTSGSIQLDPDRVYLKDGISTTQETYNAVADSVLRRSTTNVEFSSSGDPIAIRSLYGMVAQGVHNTQVVGSTLTVTKSDDTTPLGTRTVTTSDTAEPITGINSD